MIRTRIAPLFIVSLTAAGAFGCGEDFAPYNRLTSLRVLAIQSEPVAPGPDETTTLTPLIFTPQDQEIDSLSWRFCPFPGAPSDGYPCLITQQDLADMGGAGDVPDFDLGDQPTATLKNTLDPALLKLLCAGTPEAPDLVDCTGGFPAQIKLTARLGDEEVVTVSTLRLRFDPDSEQNENPSIDDLVAVVGGEEQVLGDDGAITLPRGEKTVVRARIPDGTAETYAGEDENGDPAEVTEHLVFTWFVETGDTHAERTGFLDGQVPLDEALENTWKPGPVDEYPSDTARLFVVLRDDRGGIAWKSATVSLEERP